MSLLDRYRLFLLDLDDTLYLERDYVLSGLAAVAEAMGAEPSKKKVDAALVKAWLQQRFLTQGREQIFNACLRHFGRTETPEAIEKLVSIYRHHAPTIELLPGVAAVLDELKRRGDIVIVTDGLPVMQKQKVAALGLEHWASRVFFCWQHDTPKPDVSALRPLLSDFAGPVLVIGDNPGHDLCMAETLGVDSIRIRQGRYAELNSAPWRPIREVSELPALLALSS